MRPLGATCFPKMREVFLPIASHVSVSSHVLGVVYLSRRLC